MVIAEFSIYTLDHFETGNMIVDLQFLEGGMPVFYITPLCLFQEPCLVDQEQKAQVVHALLLLQPLQHLLHTFLHAKGVSGGQQKDELVHFELVEGELVLQLGRDGLPLHLGVAQAHSVAQDLLVVVNVSTHED